MRTSGVLPCNQCRGHVSRNRLTLYAISNPSQSIISQRHMVFPNWLSHRHGTKSTWQYDRCESDESPWNAKPHLRHQHSQLAFGRQSVSRRMEDRPSNYGESGEEDNGVDVLIQTEEEADMLHSHKVANAYNKGSFSSGSGTYTMNSGLDLPMSLQADAPSHHVEHDHDSWNEYNQVIRPYIDSREAGTSSYPSSVADEEFSHPSAQAHPELAAYARRSRVYTQQDGTVKLFVEPLTTEVKDAQRRLSRSEENIGLREVMRFCLPALGALLADPLMSLVDTVCVGQVSALELAALGPNTAIFGFVSQVYSFLTTATTGLVASRIAQRQYTEAGQKVSNALVCAVVLGAVTTLTLLTCGPSILDLFATNSELRGPALQYMAIRALSIPALLVSTVATAACLGQRDSATPLRVAGTVGLANLAGDIFLVLGPPRLGIVGAAVATAAAQYVGAGVYLWLLWRRPQCPLGLRVPSRAELAPFFTTSSVLMLRSLCLCAVLCCMTYSATSLGNTVIAGHQVAISALTVSQFVPEPISQCAQSMLAHKPGHHPEAPERKARANLAVLLLKMSAVSGLCMSVVMGLPWCYPQWFVADLAVQAAVRSAGAQLSVAAGLLSVVCVSDGLLLASLDYKYCMLTNLLNLVVIGGILTIFSPSALPGVWEAMVLFQGSRLVQNFARLNHKRIICAS